MHDLALGIRFANGTTGTMDARPEFFSQLDTTKKGTQTIHLTFLGLETADTLDILVHDKRAASIVLGEQALTVSYAGKTAAFSITVRARITAALELRSNPVKLVYAPGEVPDPTDGLLRVVFESSDQYEETLPLTAAAVTGFDPGKPGLQTLTVSYCGGGATFKIMVSELVRSSAIVAENGGVRLTLALNKAQTARAIVCAYRNGRLVTAHLTTDTEFSVLLKHAQETGTFVLFLLDEAHCPILKSQTLN